LFIGQYKGIREVNHGGATAAYRAFLARYPDQHVSVAVLCNVSSAAVEQLAHAVADVYLAGALKPASTQSPVSAVAADLESLVGLYRNTERGDTIPIDRDGNVMRVGNAARLVALSPLRFTLPAGGPVLEFDGRGGARLMESGMSHAFERVSAAQPTPAELGALAGTYVSDDAEVTLKVGVREGVLELTRRPDSTIRLTPLYTDAFSGPLGTVIFRRDAAGRATELSVVQDRVWDLRFRRQPGGTQ
jgi:hypothetical protein